MDPVSTLQSIVTIAKEIYAQVQVVKSNRAKLNALAETVQCVIESLEGLNELPKNQQFIRSLNALQRCLRETCISLKKFSSTTRLSRLDRFINARTYAGDIDGFKSTILELVPLLNLGLAAEQLIDRERDRRNEENDRLEQYAVQEAYFRELQAAQLKESDLNKIVYQQMQSLEERVMHHQQPISPVSEKSSLPKELLVNLSDIVFHDKISDSDIGTLYHGEWRGQPVTIKWLENLNSEEDRHHFMREAKVMSRLHNEYITPFYGACFEKTRLCLLMGVMEKGNLSQILPTLTAQERLRMAQDLARGLAYLHDQGIVHGDIKLDHIGVNRYNQVKWTDFGLVKTHAMSLASAITVNQEASWQAPESWQRRTELTAASDIYSFGLLLWTLVTGNLPYSTLSSAEIMTRVQEGYRETIPGNLSPELMNLIAACWSSDTSLRPSASELAQQLQCITFTPRDPSPTGEDLYEQADQARKAGQSDEAYTLFNRAAEKGYFKAFTSIGLFKLSGIGGCPINKPEARHYLERAAEHGHARAMFNLGRLYEKGDTEMQIPNYPEALSWYKRALEADPAEQRARDKVEILQKLLQDSDSTYKFATKMN